MAQEWLSMRLCTEEVQYGIMRLKRGVNSVRTRDWRCSPRSKIVGRTCMKIALHRQSQCHTWDCPYPLLQDNVRDEPFLVSSLSFAHVLECISGNMQPKSKIHTWSHQNSNHGWVKGSKFMIIVHPFWT